jgi:hypothetical protein
MSDWCAVPPVEAGYDFRNGAELGKILNDMAHIPYHWYDDTPISFEEEAFFIPDDLLTVPLGTLRTLVHIVVLYLHRANHIHLHTTLQLMTVRMLTRPQFLPRQRKTPNYHPR